MPSIAAITSNHSVTLPVDVEAATPSAHAAVEPTAPSSASETSISSLPVSDSLLGGLHPIAHEPGTALFGLIAKAVHDAQSKDPPSSDGGGWGCSGPLGATDRSGLTEIKCRADQYTSLGSLFMP